MTRPFLGLFVAAFGGIGLVDRVNNTASALAKRGGTWPRGGAGGVWGMGKRGKCGMGWALWVCPKRKGCPRQ